MSGASNTQGPGGASTVSSQAAPTEEEIREMPWKYIGYRGYSEFLASDNEHFIYRRFSTLNARVALVLQDKVCHLEQELAAFDALHSIPDPVPYNNGTLRDDLPSRTRILENLTSALERYNAYILQITALQAFPQAPRRCVSTLKRWHQLHDDCVLAQDEMSYLTKASELISLLPADKTPIRQVIDRSERLRTLSIWADPEAPKPPQGSEHVLYFSDKRLDRFASIVIIIIGLTMLLTPLWILQAVQEPLYKLVVISVFVLAFLVSMSVTMAAKPFEGLAATAAYAAVLMVFLQIDT